MKNQSSFITEKDIPVWSEKGMKFNSGQCISADEKVKKNVGGTTFVITVFRSSLTLC